MRLIRKVVADLWSARGRAGLVIVAMGTGFFAVVSIAVTNAILEREMTRSFGATSPASATIRTEPAPLATLDAAGRIPGVAAYVVGRTVTGRAMVGDERVPVILSTVADYGAITVDRLRHETGAYPPPDGAIVLERAAVRVAKLRIGESLGVRIGRREPVALHFAGTVHDFSVAPAWQEGVVYGYVSRATMARLAGDSGLAELRIIVAERPLDVVHIRDVANRVGAAIERSGTHVRDVQIPRPGRHPHQDQMSGLLGMQQAFGAVALLLSSALMTALLGAMLVQHQRQIGAMKAIGARRGAIVRMYVLWLLVMAGCAEIVALPLGVAAGRVYARFVAEMLNFDVASDAVPPPLLLFLVAFGGALPVLIALVPIVRAASITTRAALVDVATVPTSDTRGRRTTSSQRGRLAALGFANALRARARFALVVGTLAVGGALFLSSLNLGRSIQQTLAVSFARLGYDIALGVGDELTPNEATAIARTVPGITTVEASTRARATIGDRADPSPNAFALEGTAWPAPRGPLTRLSGRWLRADDAHAVVANHVWLREHPRYAVGDSITLRLGTTPSRWLLVGVVREVVAGATLYARAAIVDSVSRGHAYATQLHVGIRNHDPAAAPAVMASIERAFMARGVAVGQMQSLQNTRQHREDHMIMIIGFLVGAAVLSQLVGGLGLATVLSVGIIERSREIGVMRAVGATRRQLLMLVVVEGAWIAAAGWIGSVVVSIPATIVLARVFGRMMLAAPLDVHFSVSALPALAAVSGVVALVASALPAWRASLLEPRALLTDA